MPPFLRARRPILCFAVLTLLPSGAVRLCAQDRPMDPVVGTLPSDLERYVSHASSHYYFTSPDTPAVRLLFLPPELPILESPIPLRSPLDSGVPPPAELAAHVGDLFYPQLASRLAGDELARRARIKLESYEKLKQSLLDELEAAIAAAREVPGEARRAALAECAARQAVRLQELEAAAEQLRVELSLRPEGRPLPPEQPATSLPSEGPGPLNLRTAAFYAEGLSPCQRRLLLAAAAELRLRDVPPVMGTVFFFSPEGAALRLPAALPPGLATAIATYADARHALLSGLLAELERPVGDRDRLRDLANRQAPAFDALENQAEEIRVALRETERFDGLPAAPALPPDLTARLAAYNSRKQALLREISASLSDSVRTAATPVSGGLAVPVSAFSPAQQDALTALNRERDSIRAALVERSRASGTAQDRKSVDNLLQDFERARQAQELRAEYTEYRTAVLEPGLSPAQRRLLLDGAFQHLELPLPSGKFLSAQ